MPRYVGPWITIEDYLFEQETVLVAGCLEERGNEDRILVAGLADLAIAFATRGGIR